LVIEIVYALYQDSLQIGHLFRQNCLFLRLSPAISKAIKVLVKSNSLIVKINNFTPEVQLCLNYMREEIFRNISKIIERDSKVTTYKFALLRGLIDIIQENSPYISFSGGRAHFPTGLLIEKWILFYYPILESPKEIPQINGNVNIAFMKQLRAVILFYRERGGFSTFYNDLKTKGIPKELNLDFLKLTQRLQNTITMMPMKHIGYSIYNTHYSIFDFQSPKSRLRATSLVDLQFLINNLGYFSIPIDYYDAFKVLGSFIGGQDSILFKWAEFSVKASGKSLSIESVVNEVLRSPITERDITESRKIYNSILKKESRVYCVWTGKAIAKYDVDHMIPFSVWKNNDLWNLLPSQAIINNQKRDKIPSPELIERRMDLILYYWKLVHQDQTDRFQKEMQVALLGKKPFSDWQHQAILQLQNNCKYLISNRGFDEWNIK